LWPDDATYCSRRFVASLAWSCSSCIVINEKTFDRKINKYPFLVLMEKLCPWYHHAACMRRALRTLYLATDCYKIWCEQSVPRSYSNNLLPIPVNSNNNIAETLTCALGVTLAPLNTQFWNYLW
jgi:hypothetical protein